MTDLAKHAGLPWDCILGAELARHYKPDREVYQSAADILDLKPADVMMVAAHLGDLRAAKAVGLKTAFVARPMEYGPDGKPDLKADASVDLSATDFNDLARSSAPNARLNAVLDAHGFDRFVEGQCRRFYAPVMGRPSLAPGRYFRLLLVGYFEGIDSERGIAWRAADSLAVRSFLRLARATRRRPITRRSRGRGA